MISRMNHVKLQSFLYNFISISGLFYICSSINLRKHKNTLLKSLYSLCKLILLLDIIEIKRPKGLPLETRYRRYPTSLSYVLHTIQFKGFNLFQSLKGS